MTRPRENPSSSRPADAFMAAMFSCSLVGLGVARLTLKLNPHLAERFFDCLLLHLWLIAGYALVGMALGTLGAMVIAGLQCFAWRRTPSRLTVEVFGLAPLAYFLLLPNVGLGSQALTRVLTGDTGARLIGLASLAIGLVVVSFAISALLHLVSIRGGKARPWLALAGILIAVGMVAGIRPEMATRAAATPVTELAERINTAGGTSPPDRVVLLCIDGADLQVILPMIEQGDLPTFARFTREGTWGSLATFEPTLSPVIWTSLITGKPPAAHGIHHFLHFRLPGVRQAIYHFPLHTGLNFRFFPLLEQIPGLPNLRTPNTSNMRRAQALWNIVGYRYPVGAYRWLVSWPAEKVNGFSIAGSIGWVDFDKETRREVQKDLPPGRGQNAQPPALARMLKPRSREVPQEVIDAHVGDGLQLDRRDPRLTTIIKSHNDPTGQDLPVLIDQFGARFTAANFYSVDPFHHLYNSYRRQGGVLANAIAERYRTTDARLGQLVEALGEDTQVLVVSDHGFDFENSHHTYAPPGIFFALGPAFSPGRRVDTLSVMDIAPMVLRLLDMPLAEDMPGTGTGNYQAALSPEFIEHHQLEKIATYETLEETQNHESMESPQDDAIRDVLKSLGYIQ